MRVNLDIELTKAKNAVIYWGKIPTGGELICVVHNLRCWASLYIYKFG